MDQANSVGPTSVEGSFFSLFLQIVLCFSRHVFSAAVFYVASDKAYKDEIALCLSSVSRPTQVIWGANDQVTGNLLLHFILTLGLNCFSLFQ